MLQYCFYFMIFGHEACGILVPQPEIETIPLAFEAEILTTGPPEKSWRHRLEGGLETEELVDSLLEQWCSLIEVSSLLPQHGQETSPDHSSSREVKARSLSWAWEVLTQVSPELKEWLHDVMGVGGGFSGNPHAEWLDPCLYPSVGGRPVHTRQEAGVKESLGKSITLKKRPTV